MVEVGLQTWAVCPLSLCLLPLLPRPSQLERMLQKPDVDNSNSTDTGNDLERIPASDLQAKLAGCVSVMGEGRPHAWGSPPPDLPLMNPVVLVSHFFYSRPQFSHL